MSLLTTTSSPGTWVTTVVQQDTDIRDLGEWWDLLGTISMPRLGREPGTHIAPQCFERVILENPVQLLNI